MRITREIGIALSIGAVAALAAAGCGGGGSSKTSSTSSSTNAAGALSAEAQSAATGDIPDNQAFLVFRNSAAGYSIKYPEGWTTVGSGKDVKISDKNNLVRIVTGTGSAPTPQSAGAELVKLKAATPSLKVTSQPKVTSVKGRKVVKSGYSTASAPNSVTGKRVLLLVDRYEFVNKGKPVTVDLGTPKGVDNVDAYRLMIESFKSS